MVDVFRPMDDGVPKDVRILQGQSYKNFLFGGNATIEDYKKKGLYLEVGPKPTITKLQEVNLVSETPDHTTKTLNLAWEIVDKAPEQIAEIVRVKEIETCKVESGLNHITIEQAEAWVTSRLMVAADAVSGVTNVATAKTAMNQILLAVQDINKRELPFFINGH